jgi:hypothetical protein
MPRGSSGRVTNACSGHSEHLEEIGGKLPDERGEIRGLFAGGIELTLSRNGTRVIEAAGDVGARCQMHSPPDTARDPFGQQPGILKQVGGIPAALRSRARASCVCAAMTAARLAGVSGAPAAVRPGLLRSVTSDSLQIAGRGFYGVLLCDATFFIAMQQRGRMPHRKAPERRPIAMARRGCDAARNPAASRISAPSVALAMPPGAGIRRARPPAINRPMESSAQERRFCSTVKI